MSKLSKDTKQRIVISLTSESAGKELIDAIENSIEGSGDEYALKDLSNIAGTAIPAGVNLESLNTSQSSLTSFKLKTKDQTDSVSGRIDIISGSAASSFSTGSINLFSGGTPTASGAGSTTVMTGSVSLSSGGISGGTKGSTGSGNLRSGNLFISTPGTVYTGNTGNVILAAGQVSCSVTGSSVTGNGGNAVVGGGGLTAIAGSVIGNSGSVSVTSGIILSNSTGSVTGNTGTARFGTGNIQGSSTTIGNTGNTELYSGPVFNLTNVGNTGSVDVYTGNNSGVGNTGNVNIYTGQPFGGGLRGSVFLDGQGTMVKLRNYDVVGDHSLFNIYNDSPGGYGSIQFLTYAMGNNTMGMRIFDSDSSSGFSIRGWGRLNENGGPFDFISTGVTPSTDGALTGGDFNISSGSTGNVFPPLGFNNSINSGNINIFTPNGWISGTNTDSNSGNINLTTGQKTGSGIRGNITMNSKETTIVSDFVKLQNYTRLVLEDNTGDQLVRLQLTSPTAEGYGQFFFNRIRSDKSVFIGAMESHVDDNGAPVHFSGTFLLSDNDGQYKTSDVYLQTLTNSGFRDAPNVAVSTGDIYIKTESSFVQGTETDANTGNITLQTGTPSGAGTKGYISLNADYITANSTQLKNLADGTDPQDAVTLSQLQAATGGGGGDFANRDLSNLVGPTAIPANVGLISLQSRPVLAPMASFDISTAAQSGTDGSGGLRLHSGNIFNITSAQSTGFVALSTGLTLGSGNTGDISIFSGDNVGSGNSGNVNISTGASVAGTRGDVVVNARNIIMQANGGTVQAKQELLVLDNAGLNYSHIGNQDPNFSFMVVGAFDSPIHASVIGPWKSIGQSGGYASFHGSYVQGTVDGTFKASDVYLESKTAAGGAENTADNLEISSGNITVRSHDAFIKGTGANANTGNITLQTGAAQGSGTKGYILLSGSFVSANLTQIKNVANATDPGDAVNLSQLDAKTRAGSVSIPNASNTVTVTFSSDIGTSNYSVNLQIQNTVDASPLFLDKLITSQSSTGFTVKFSQNTDSANYNVQYVAQLFN